VVAPVGRRRHIQLHTSQGFSVWFCRTCQGLSASKGSCQVSSSHSTTPKAYTSDALPCSCSKTKQRPHQRRVSAASILRGRAAAEGTQTRAKKKILGPGLPMRGPPPPPPPPPGRVLALGHVQQGARSDDDGAGYLGGRGR